MNIRIASGALSGETDAITSKSAAHRLLICAAFADKPSEIIIENTSEDIEATVSCLSAMGADIKRNTNTFAVVPTAVDKVNENALINCKASGSTLRFILPLAAAAGKNLIITGTDRLPERPVKELIEALVQNGAVFSSETMPYTVSGRLRGGTYRLPGNVSSGYISGLMFVLPLLQNESEIILISPLESSAYVDMTVKTLNLFGVEIIKTMNGWRVNGNQIFKSPHIIRAERDWSNAAFFLTAGAIGNGKELCVNGLDINSAQSDKRITELLKTLGAEIKISEEKWKVKVKRKKLEAFEADVSDIPDLLPILAVAGAFAEGRTVLYNAARLRFKESDRLSVTAEMLNAFGFSVNEETDRLIISGGTRRKINSITVDSKKDHRIAMSAAVAASALTDCVTVIKNAEAVNKSYPAFFEDYIKLGGTADVI